MRVSGFSTLCCALIIMIQSGAPLLAQSVDQTADAGDTFSLEPITFDIDDQISADTTEEVILVTAYTPQALPPRISRFNTASREARPTTVGRPSPSIVLGIIEPGAEERFGIEGLLDETVAAFGFAFDDLESREALRTSNPELFRELVQGGHIDPPEEQLARVLQQELARMNCYRSSIDGVWGGGSRRSVTSYFQTLDNGNRAPSSAPSNELFRSIVLNGDVTCRVARVQQPTTPSVTNNRPRRTTPAPQAAPAPARPPASSGSSVPRAGVFR